MVISERFFDSAIRLTCSERSFVGIVLTLFLCERSEKRAGVRGSRTEVWTASQGGSVVVCTTVCTVIIFFIKNFDE